MKQQILNLKKKLLIVEESKQGLYQKIQFLESKYGKAKKIGKLTDITEQQFAQLVLVGWSISFKTAKESFFSYLEANEIYFENKFLIPEKNEYNFGYGHNESELYNKHLNQWQEAEQKVWNLNNCYIFEIL